MYSNNRTKPVRISKRRKITIALNDVTDITHLHSVKVSRKIPVYVAVGSGAVTGYRDLYHHLSGRVVQHSGHVLALPFIRENRADIS